MGPWKDEKVKLGLKKKEQNGRDKTNGAADKESSQLVYKRKT